MKCRFFRIYSVWICHGGDTGTQFGSSLPEERRGDFEHGTRACASILCIISWLTDAAKGRDVAICKGAPCLEARHIITDALFQLAENAEQPPDMAK